MCSFRCSHRPAFIGLALAIATVVGCSSEGTATLRLTVDYDPSWPVGSFDVYFGDDFGAAVTPASEVIIDVPDAVVEQSIAVSVRALAEDAEWAAGVAQVIPARGQQTEVSIALTRPSCNANEDCVAPQNQVCASAEAVRNYGDGECVDDGCVFYFDEAVCAQPPQDGCRGGTTQVYSGAGSCGGGGCSYEFTATPCDGICIDNICDESCSAAACGAPQIVADSLASLHEIELAAGTLYWLSDASVQGRANDGSSVTTFFSGAGYRALATDDSHVYVARGVEDNQVIVYQGDLDGPGEWTVVAEFDGAAPPRVATVDADYIYLGTDGRGVYRIAKTNGDVRHFISSGGARVDGIVVDDEYVYWVMNHAIFRYPKDDPTSTFETPYMAPERFSSLAADADYLYLTTPDDGNVMRWHKATEEVEILATAQYGAREIGVSGSHIYWANPAGLARKNIAGGVVEWMPANDFHQWQTFAFDDRYFYWTTDREGVGAVRQQRLCCFGPE